MGRFRVLATPLGEHHSPDGVIHVTRPRVQRWVDTWRKLNADGVRFPLTWGHQLQDGHPFDSEDAFQEAMSRRCAGYIEGMEVDPETGGLAIIGNAPGVELADDGSLQYWTKLPSGQLVKGTIREVSSAIHSWTDGKGRHWRDLPIHVGLVTHPVCAGQRGFQPVGDGPVRSNPAGPQPVHLSTLTLRGATTVMTDDEFDRWAWGGVDARRLSTLAEDSLFATSPDDEDADERADSDAQITLAMVHRLSTLSGRADLEQPGAHYAFARATLARGWKAGIKRRLHDLIRRGLDPNAASGFWAGLKGKAGMRRLSALRSGAALQNRVERQLLAWEAEYPEGNRGAGKVPLSRAQQEIADALSGRRELNMAVPLSRARQHDLC